MTDSVRCFIAVRMPEEVGERLRWAQERLRAAEQDWKWVNPATFHITLKFLGQVERPRLGALWQTVREAVSSTRAFQIVLRGAGAFPNLRSPRVVWVGVTEGAEEVKALAGRVEGACRGHGFEEEEKRPFTPHLTLGRARETSPNPALAAAIEGLAEEDFGRGEIDRLLLVRSELTPKGAVYHLLEEQVLK